MENHRRLPWELRIHIYNAVGEKIEEIDIRGIGVEGTRAGYNEVSWDARDIFNKQLSNGVYLYIIVVEGDKKQTSAKGKMMILRR